MRAAWERRKMNSVRRGREMGGITLDSIKARHVKQIDPCECRS